MRILLKDNDSYYLMEFYNLLNKRIGSISFSKPRNNLIYVYTFEILKQYQNKGYGNYLFKNFIDNFGDKANIKAKIIGGEKNISCSRIFKKYGFIVIDRTLYNWEVYREKNN